MTNYHHLVLSWHVLIGMCLDYGISTWPQWQLLGHHIVHDDGLVRLMVLVDYHYYYYYHLRILHSLGIENQVSMVASWMMVVSNAAVAYYLRDDLDDTAVDGDCILEE